MASKLMILSIGLAVLVGVTISLPVNNEDTASVTTTAEPEQETSSEAGPEGTIFNYELPTEEELNPEDLDEEQKLLQELRPPAIDSPVTFYETPEKPRKGGKKYKPDEKWINKSPVAGSKEASSEENEERQYALLDFIIENLFLGIADQFNQNVQPRGLVAEEAADETPLVLNKGEYIPNPQRRIDDESATERVVLQVHGHQGEGSYKFGYDTGMTANSDTRN